jgi:hypothetical protein
MKRILLVFSCIFSVLAMAQETEEPYDFPVKPGTEQWAKLTTSDQMDEVCVIPDQVLSIISTKDLLITCLNYPRIIDFYLADNLQSGFDKCSKRFNGLTELLNRSDINQVLLKSYLDIDIQNKTMKGYSGTLSHLQVGFIELLIAQEKIIRLLNEEEKKILISEATIKLEKRKEIGESLYRQMTTAFILSRILTSENLAPSAIDTYGNDIFNVFNSSAVILDTTIINKLLVASKRMD